jgi:hypothetical protein
MLRVSKVTIPCFPFSVLISLFSLATSWGFFILSLFFSDIVDEQAGVQEWMRFSLMQMIHDELITQSLHMPSKKQVCTLLTSPSRSLPLSTPYHPRCPHPRRPRFAPRWQHDRVTLAEENVSTILLLSSNSYSRTGHIYFGDSLGHISTECGYSYRYGIEIDHRNYSP